MNESEGPARFCLHCGAENAFTAVSCRDCGLALRGGDLQRRTGIAFLLNELETLLAQGIVSHAVYLSLRDRYREALGTVGQPSSPAGRPRQPLEGRRQRPAVVRQEGPSWLAEQQANLLLYLGAFLTVIAVLIYVSSSGEAIGGGVRMALLAVYTLMFMAAGLLCMRLPRVRQAGVVFFAVAALMVPLNFVGAYFFLLSDGDMDPTGLWLGGSLACALFYGAVSLLRLGGWYPVPMVLAVLSALGAGLVLADAPPEAYPGSFIALGFVIAAPSTFSLGRASEVLGGVGLWAAHIVVPPALCAALAVAAAAGADHADLELTTRWYLPPTVAIAALFYWVQALQAQRVYTDIEPVLTVVALSVTGGVLLTLVYALDVGTQWYGPAVAIVGWLYAGGSEGFGPRWFGRRYLRWMALCAVTISWLFLEPLYSDFPREGAGVHFAAAVFYLVAARLVTADIPVIGQAMSGAGETAQTEYYRVLAAVAFVYAAGLTLGIGFFYLLASLPAAETAEESDLGLAYFGLSLAVAAVAATMRWWWGDMRLHVYAIAAGMSLFALLASADAEGWVAVFLVVYTGVALALTFWEWEPLVLPLAPAYGFVALLATWRYYEPSDALLPTVLSAVGYALFAGYVMLRNRARRWADVLQVLAFGYVLAAPVVGWVKLAVLADPEGFVDGQRFEETLLYQTSAASVLLVAGLMVAQWRMVRRPEIAVGASAVAMVALLLEIGHFRPDNVQAYTAPLGLYLLGGALVASRVRDLPEDMRPLMGLLEIIGAALIMAPSLEQSFGPDGWGYGLILLVEGLGFVALAIVNRRLWLLGTAVTFVVLDGLHYLFFAGGPAVPNWAILAIAGTVVMAAGVAMLLGRDRWIAWQRTVQDWWSREPAASPAD